MKSYSKDDIKKIYASRKEKLFSYMKENNITAAVFSDFEENRSPAVRYYTGHPQDAILIVTADGKTVLTPWD